MKKSFVARHPIALTIAGVSVAALGALVWAVRRPWTHWKAG